MKTLLIIDGNAMMHRAYFALPELATNSGIPTNAIYGFFTMLHKVITDFAPTHVIVTFDTPVPTFRKKLYVNYQINRPRAADGFKQQIPLIQELLDIAGITRVQKEGFEADDVIGTLARRHRDDFERILILTGDRDLLQLIDKKTFVISPQKGITTSTIYTEDAVQEKYGISPKQIPDLKGLMGDPSDNYSGAKGIGPKTASKLINEFGSVEKMLEHVDEIKPERIAELIKTHKDNVILSKQLATILTDIDFDCDLEKSAFTSFKPEMAERLKELELYSLVARFFKNNVAPKKEVIKKPVKKVDENQSGLF